MSDIESDVELSWDDDPYDGTGHMLGIMATSPAPHNAGEYRIMRWHGAFILPEWQNTDVEDAGERIPYGSGGQITLVVDGKEEKIGNTRSLEEAIAIAKTWCIAHAARIS
jgi:hypothetical protein